MDTIYYIKVIGVNKEGKKRKKLNSATKICKKKKKNSLTFAFFVRIGIFYLSHPIVIQIKPSLRRNLTHHNHYC